MCFDTPNLPHQGLKIIKVDVIKNCLSQGIYIPNRPITLCPQSFNPGASKWEQGQVYIQRLLEWVLPANSYQLVW